MNEPVRLLIIDDDEDTLTALSGFLKKKGYDAVSASNGLDGIKLLEDKKERFDLIITDIVMPNVSGVGVISIAKKKYPHIATIAITGWGEHPEALAIEAQADVVLRKPFQLDELEKIISDLLGKVKREG